MEQIALEFGFLERTLTSVTSTCRIGLDLASSDLSMKTSKISFHVEAEKHKVRSSEFEEAMPCSRKPQRALQADAL